MHDLVIRNAKIVDGTGAPAYTGDIAIHHGRIAALGDVPQKGRREIDAEGDLVTPGWVDIHTHYDGQVTWDPYLTPSSWHGVTTVVMGNCGVGFAPAKPDRHDWLIGLMEGVEDIPGAALAEGIKWQWESFPEYLDALDTQKRTIDVATHVPHGAVRAYVMGERGANNEAANPDDIKQMAEIVEEGLRAGALGFSTSRTMLHLSKDGVPVPGTFANRDELIGIGRALQKAGAGVFEMASDLTPAEEEFSWMADLSKETGLPITYALLQSPFDPDQWKKILAMTDQAVAEGANIHAQIALRPTGLILGWQSTVHPFSLHPSYKEIAELPFAERLARLKEPAMKAKLLSETPDEADTNTAIAGIILQGFDHMFRLVENDKPNYEPEPEKSVASLAAQTGRPAAEIVYDMMMEDDGTGYVYLPILNYANCNFDHIHTMFENPNTVLSLSDGGAHCGVICDASFPTYLLTHWVRDRSRGARFGLEQAVARQTSHTAQLYGLNDRGVIAVGMKADLNVIDFEQLKLHGPQMVFDLPAGGRRLIQRAEGYRWTIVSGEITFENGTPTGKMPGRLIRGPQNAPQSLAAE